jgi:hypothetical protein
VLVGTRIVSRAGRAATEPADPPGVPGRRERAEGEHKGSQRERGATRAACLALAPGALSEERAE